MKKIIAIAAFLVGLYTACFAQEASSNIKSLLSSNGKVFYGNEPNAIVVIDYPENIERVSEYLNIIDVPPEQVMIEARFVEVKLQKEHSLGVNWKLFADKGYWPLGPFKVGTGSLGAVPGPLLQNIEYKPTFVTPLQSTSGVQDPFTLAIFNDNINVVLQALSNTLDTNILSAPKVTTINNRQAEIKMIQSQPWAEPSATTSDSGAVTVTWTIHFEEVGITLKVTPTINEDGRIALDLAPEVSEKVNDFELELQVESKNITYKVPIIDKRTASTKVIVGNGQTLIIGGLMKDKSTKEETKVPLLGDIPGIGYLFKSKKETTDKTELLIFVSPTLITSNEFARVRVEEKYGLSKGYTKEREDSEQLILERQAEAKVQEENAHMKLDSLTQKHSSLVEQRKKLEVDIRKEEADLKVMEETQKTSGK